jgi:hypothetical protein
MNANFIVLDHYLRNEDSSESGEGENSYIDIAFGNDRGGFAGLHRFEVVRSEVKDDVTVCYSGMCCNPSVNELALPRIVMIFHEFYAERLFWDGVRGVSKAQ